MTSVNGYAKLCSYLRDLEGRDKAMSELEVVDVQVNLSFPRFFGMVHRINNQLPELYPLFIHLPSDF